MSEKQSDNPELKVYLAALGHRVRAARAKRGMARRILARDSGVSERYLAQLEGGTGNPTVAVLRQIANAVDYPLSALVVGDAAPITDPELAPIVARLQALPPDLLPQAKAVLDTVGTGPCSPVGLATAKSGRVALIGLRGAGKSTLGRLLAERLSIPFVELNRLVEGEYGGSIGEILALSGQSAFRRLERRALDGVVAEYRTAIIATGGGLVSEPTTFQLLLNRCHTVWIKASPEEHMSRVIDQGDLRPMSKNDEAMDDLRAILDAREADYRKADAIVDTEGKTIDESLVLLETAVRGLLL